MQAPDPVEAILARLMPPGLSGPGQQAVESMIDELSAEPSIVAVVPVAPSPRPTRRFAWWAAAAAAGIAIASLFPFHAGRGLLARGGPAQPLAHDAADFVWVGGSGRIESMTEDGWHDDADGVTMRAMRLSVVEEENLLDEETGIVMTVSEPREEILLMPISAF